MTDGSMTEATEAAPYLKPLPDPAAASQPYWDAAREHRLLIQRSKKTGQYVFYPRVVSPFGADDELEWVEATGRGTVYSYTIAHRPTGPQWANDVPYVIAIIALEEGPHMTANVIDCDPAEVAIGMAVVATYQDVTADVTLVQFRPA